MVNVRTKTILVLIGVIFWMLIGISEPSLAQKSFLQNDKNSGFPSLAQTEVNNFTHLANITLSQPTPSSDFQVLVTLSPQTIEYDHIQENGSDIRFYTLDFLSCPYWIDNWDSQSESRIWVNVPTTGTTKLLMLYGNAGLESASDGNSTFILYNDWNTDGDLDGWNLDQGTYVVENGYLKISTSVGTGYAGVTQAFTTEDIIVELDWKPLSTPSNWKQMYLYFRWDTPPYHRAVFRVDTDDVVGNYFDSSTGSSFTYTSQWYNIKISHANGEADAYLDGTKYLTCSYSDTSDEYPVEFWLGGSDDGNGHYFDNFRIRQYSTTDIIGNITHTQVISALPDLTILIVIVGLISSITIFGIAGYFVFYRKPRRPNTIESKPSLV